MIFPQPPEPYDLQLAMRYRLITLTLLDAAQREDTQEMNALFEQRELTSNELTTLPNLGDRALKLLREAVALNERLVTLLRARQASYSGELVNLHHNSRGTGSYLKGFTPSRGDALEETG